MRYIYKDKTGVCVNDEQFEILKEFFTQDKPECPNREVTLIPPAVALKMVRKAKESVKEDVKIEEPKVEKPKRKRRSKEQIEADKIAGK